MSDYVASVRTESPEISRRFQDKCRKYNISFSFSLGGYCGENSSYLTSGKSGTRLFHGDKRYGYDAGSNVELFIAATKILSCDKVAIRVELPEKSRRLQKLLFENGYEWKVDDADKTRIRNEHTSYLFLYPKQKQITCGNFLPFGTNHRAPTQGVIDYFAENREILPQTASFSYDDQQIREYDRVTIEFKDGQHTVLSRTPNGELCVRCVKTNKISYPKPSSVKKLSLLEWK